MKVALIFSGFFRTFNYVKDSLFEHVINVVNPDIFFSSPKTLFALPDHEANEFHATNSQNEDLVDYNVFGNKLIACELREYSSKFYKDIIDSAEVGHINQFNQYHWRILSQMDSVSLSVKLFQRYVERYNLNYDLVILTRPDIKYYSNINLELIDKDLLNYPLHSKVGDNINTVSCPPSHSLDKPFNDQIITGSQENIIKYSSIYDNILPYVKEGICFNPETLFGIHAQKNGIDFKAADYVLYELWRHGKF